MKLKVTKLKVAYHCLCTV